MVEQQAHFLIRASSVVSQIQSDRTQEILKSYYLLRCNKLTGDSKLPQKHFSRETRCPHCHIEWRKDTERKLKPIKLSKKQRRRLRCNRNRKKNSVNKEYLLHSNEMVKVCSFCRHTTKSAVVKPSETQKHAIDDRNCVVNIKTVESQVKKAEKQKVHNYQSNVYCNSKVAFSLSTQNNTLASLIKESPKIIKNNKKKKDKFAGLCRTAVIAAAKLKQAKENQNKLNQFLKPAT